jgi:NitT/TauT family transport system permease protein
MKAERWILPLIAMALFLGIWEWVCASGGVAAYLLAKPSQILASLWFDRGELGPAFLATAACAFLGFVMSVVGGVLVAIVLTSSRWAFLALYPYAVVFQTIPIIAIAPLLVIWFGFGAPTVVASSFIASVFPVIMATLNGLKACGTELRELFQLYGASRQATLIKLLLPMAMPEILTGLRIAAGLCVIGAIVGEFVGGGGLGSVVDAARTQQRLEVVFAAVFLASALGGVAIVVIDMVNRAVLNKWNPRSDG